MSRTKKTFATMSLSVLFLLSCIGFSGSTLAANKDIVIKKDLYEILLKENGEEIRFKTETPKPQMTFEEEVTVINESEKRKYKDFVYTKKIPKGLRFIEFKEVNGAKATYSSDGIDYHDELNKTTDKHVRVTIDVLPEKSSFDFRLRFTNSMFSSYN